MGWNRCWRLRSKQVAGASSTLARRHAVVTATEQLNAGADLAITTDYRVVLAEILAARAGITQPAQIFPGLPAGPAPGIAGPAAN